VEQCINCQTTEAVSHYGKYDIIVLLNSKNGTKAAKLTRDLNIPTTTLTTVLKK